MEDTLKKNISKVSILIVEDEDSVREGLVKYAKRLTNSVYEAENGKIGLDIYKKYQPEIIIADIMMPVMNGLTMSKEIKKISEDNQIIVLSAFNETEFLVEAIESGVNHYLFKPFDRRMFFSILEKSANDILAKIDSNKLINRLKTAVEQSGIMIVITNKDGIIEYVNQKFIEVIGFDFDEINSKKINILNSGKQSKEFYKNLWNTIKVKKESWKGEFINKKKSGELFFDKTTISPILDKNGEIINFIAIKEDITKQKEIENKLREKEEMLIAQSRQVAMGDMVAMIAHQWRQPISTIGMSANNMLVDIELKNIKKEEFEVRLNSINEQVAYLSKTIDDFRNFFKPDKEKEIEKLSEILKSTLNIIGKSLENNQINLKINIKDRELKVYVNELIQIFLNIISNAKDILKLRKIKNPTITIETLSEDNSYIIKICDNGGGIREKYINKIFEPYFTTKELQNGSGLGLYMSKIIMEKHLNGSIFVKNEKDGACFYCKFNLRD